MSVYIHIYTLYIFYIYLYICVTEKVIGQEKRQHSLSLMIATSCCGMERPIIEWRGP